MSSEKDINTFLHRPILSGREYDAFIPFSDCSSVLLGSGDTGFALSNMKTTALKYKHHTTELSQKFFNISSIEQLSKQVHHFLYNHIQYKLDGVNQKLRSPACSWASREVGIDCKSYSIFASTILQNLGVGHYFRRIVQHSNPDGYSHVYVVIPKDQKSMSLSSGYWVIDATIPTTKEISYLQKDDLLVFSSFNGVSLGAVVMGSAFAPRQTALSLLDNRSISRKQQPISKTNERQTAYYQFLSIVQSLQKEYPYNSDFLHLQQYVENLFSKGEKVRFFIEGLVLNINGKRFRIFQRATPEGMGNPLGYDPVTAIDDLLNNSYAIAEQNADMAGKMKKADVMMKTSAITSAASATAGVVGIFFPPAQIVALCIDAVGMLVQLAIMFWYDPCSGAYYTAEYINKRLKEDFHQNFKTTMSRVMGHLKGNTPNMAETDLNTLLKEIDLGYEHYMHEKSLGDSNVCSKSAFDSYQDFVTGVRKMVNDMLVALEASLSEFWQFRKTEVEASTSQRNWYFIVPGSRHPKMAKYRRISIDKKEQKKGVYPYDSPISFDKWLDDQHAILEALYDKKTADDYRTEVQNLGLKNKIENIRKNVYLPPAVLITQEEALRQLQYEIYIKYDKNYREDLLEKAQETQKAFLKEGREFWEELKKVKQIKLVDEKNKIENIGKVAQAHAEKKLGLQNKVNQGIALVALSMGVILWKFSNN